MDSETFRDLARQQLLKINGVDSVSFGDYNAESIEVYVDLDRKTVRGNTRPTGMAIKKALKEIGFTKSQNILEWVAPVKRKNHYGVLEISTEYFYIDVCYAYVSKEEALAGITSDFDKDSYVFDTHGYAISDEKMKELFLSTYKRVNNIDDHIELLEDRMVDYDVYILYKYEHGNVVYELQRSCRFDSGVAGVIAIKRGSSTTVESVVEGINDRINDYDEEYA